MNEPMIRVSHISKKYRLGQIGGTTLREQLQRLSAKVHHREDPTRPIGMRERPKEDFLALDDVSFDAAAGERIGIIGRNGAGKSTLLKLISRVTAPSEGMIGLNGRVASMLEVGTGFHGELTGRENIYMNGAILGMSRKEIDSKIDSIIDFSEISRFIDTPVKRYSSGMYVKLAFSVAAHLDSEIMIMDEVLAVGDMAFQRKCLEKMNDVSHTGGRTILYVSHNMDTIRRLCDRGIVLDHGKLIYDGGAEDAISLYTEQRTDQAVRITEMSDLPRMKGVSRKVSFVSADTGSDSGIYSCDDDMAVTFALSSSVSCDDMRMMMVLISKDGTRVGMTETPPFSVHEGDNSITVSFPCRGLADGSYYFEISLVHRPHLYMGERCDGISDVLPFSIRNTEVFGITSERWLRNWGHVMLSPLSVTAQS
ncbi:MAG: ABC transporter ATP-binding protein [Oscillospiraceae bacterium]|nr:ABC transporter ATP-binding protein [Oscillospiraceae bacterium]